MANLSNEQVKLPQTNMIDFSKPWEKEAYEQLAKCPFQFIYRMWGLLPMRMDEPFVKWKHITRQQALIVKAVKDAVNWGKNKITIRSGHGIWKCHAINTSVRMSTGDTKYIQDIVAWDKVMWPDWLPRMVLSTTKWFGKMYKVIQNDLTEYYVNENHVLRLVCTQTHGSHKSWDFVEVEVKDYLKRSARKKRVHCWYKVAVEYPERELEIDPYILGVRLWDWTSTKPEITNPDKEILQERYNLWVKYGMKITSTKKHSHYITNWRGSSNNPFTEILKHYNLLNNKHIPVDYMINSRENRLKLLAWLIDSDWYVNSTNCIELVQKRKELAEQIAELARSVWCAVRLKKIKKHCYYNWEKKEGEYYRIIISRNISDIPLKVERKKNAITKSDRSTLHFGIKVVQIPDDYYYWFELEWDWLYLLQDYTVTHNSSILAILIIWFLFTHPHSQIPCTAPTQSQIYDVLWKELSIWISKLPPEVKNLFEWQTDYLRMKESPETWFARARTGKKENTEALAWIHADAVMLVADEASGIADEIYEASKGALTNPLVVFIMISNPTRLEWYFYRSHTKLKEQFKTLHFSSNQSPIVDQWFTDDIVAEYGIDSDQYRIRVLWEFPTDSWVTEDWYINLINESDCHFAPIWPIKPIVMWVDPAWQGRDQTILVARDNFYMKILSRQQTSTDLSVAELVATNASSRDIPIENIVYDNFGIGANVGMEMSNLGRPIGLNVGIKANNPAIYENLRAELYWKLRERIKKWWVLIGNKEQWSDLFIIKYKRWLNGKIKIMPKDEMRKKYGKSPDVWDAAMLSFYKTTVQLQYQKKTKPRYSSVTRTVNKQETITFPDPRWFK